MQRLLSTVPCNSQPFVAFILSVGHQRPRALLQALLSCAAAFSLCSLSILSAIRSPVPTLLLPLAFSVFAGSLFCLPSAAQALNPSSTSLWPLISLSFPFQTNGKRGLPLEACHQTHFQPWWGSFKTFPSFLVLLGAYASYALPCHALLLTCMCSLSIGQNSAAVRSFFLLGSCSNPFQSWGSVPPRQTIVV